MKPSQIFDLVVRLSGYGFLLYAGMLILNMIIGPMPFSFKGFLMLAANGVAGIALMKIAPVITEFVYGPESQS